MSSSASGSSMDQEPRYDLRYVKRMKSTEVIVPNEESRLMKLPLELRKLIASYGSENDPFKATLMSRDGHTYDVDRLIMAEFSPVLDNLFQQNADAEVYKLDLDSGTLKAILDMIITDDLTITRENLYQLLDASKKLDFLAVRKRCLDFIDKETNIESAIRCRKDAATYECTWLFDKITDFILDHFGEISRQTQSFLDLSRDDLLDFLKRDELRAYQEKEVFEAVMKWIYHDVENRVNSLPILFDEIRLSLCSNEYLREVVLREPLILKKKECKKRVNQSIRYVSSKKGRLSDIVDARLYHARPRIPRELIIVIGGWQKGAATSVIETYDPRSDRWLWAPYSDINPRAYHGMVVLNGLIYCVGGFDGTVCFNSLRFFNPITRVWTEKGCMRTPRCYVSVVELNGFIYAMGGFDGRVRLNSVERYDPKENQWLLMANMSVVRSDANATTYQNKIYIVGGFTGNAVLSSGEVYDPETNEWTNIPDMPSPRSGLGVISYKNKIYALGGYNGQIRLKSGNCYDPRTRLWSNIPDMPTRRSNFSTVVLEDNIYVIGGFRSNATLASVEKYNDESDSWEMVAPMTMNRSAQNACVLSGLGTNGKIYSFLGSTESCTND